MSEQTPNSQDNLHDSSASGEEPSMEDILASIRKIISEDEPVAMESPEDIVEDLTSDAALDVPEIDAVELDVSESNDDLSALLDDVIETPAAEADPVSDVVDLDLDSVLADLNGDVETEAVVAAPTMVDSVETVAVDSATSDDDDILAMLDMEIPMESDEVQAPASAAISETDDVPVATETADDLEMDSLLDEILLASDSDVVEQAPPEQATVDNDPDLELVKSLMADLADDSSAELETDDDLESLLSIPEAEPVEEMNVEELDLADILEEPAQETEVAEATVETVETEVPEEDILGDILDMTLEDEIQTHPDDLASVVDTPSADDIAGDELTNAELNELADALSETESVEDLAVADDMPSLADIAAAAEADAVLAEQAQPDVSAVTTSATIAAAGAGAAALGAIVTSQDEPNEASVDDVPRETAATTEEQVITQEEAQMPVKAVQTDTIIDTVTETATAGAFAELNAVVEEKAVFNERGPRIGDLVQEALRPMLKDWLDANLKGIVERAVAKEVKRISSGK